MKRLLCVSPLCARHLTPLLSTDGRAHVPMQATATGGKSGLSLWRWRWAKFHSKARGTEAPTSRVGVVRREQELNKN